jgi:site-specific recombinase XerC
MQYRSKSGGSVRRPSLLKMSAIRKLAAEAADNGLLAPELAQGISRVKGVKSTGISRGQLVVATAGAGAAECAGYSTIRGLRDRAILAVLLGCGLRRLKVAALTFRTFSSAMEGGALSILSASTAASERNRCQRG